MDWIKSMATRELGLPPPSSTPEDLRTKKNTLRTTALVFARSRDTVLIIIIIMLLFRTVVHQETCIHSMQLNI